MSAVKKIAENKILRELVPLNTLSQARFKEISGKIAVEEVRAGGYLFHIDDRDKQTIFLLGGEIALLDGKRASSGTIKAGSDKSRFPIADAQPRALSARAVKKCVVARIDSSLLDAFLSWDQSNDAEAVVIGANKDDDWMTRMLQSQAFEKIPPAKIQQLLLKMDAVRFRAGTSVIRQGETGDCFYTIKKGKCAVTRKDTPQAEDRLLAELTDGDCFGEEALVLDVKRNATVTMLTDGVLMRLAKQDFVELLQKPLVRYIDYEKAAHAVDEGAIWVDVRTADEYGNGAIEDSVNIPLSSVRREMTELVFNVVYILCCDTGQRSASAAFILSHKGFDVHVLDGGLRAIPENVFHHVPDSLLADPEVTARITGYEEQISTLHGQKQQLEFDLSRAHKQQASLEQQMDELKNLHEKESESVEQKQQQSRLREELDAMQKECGSLQQKLDTAVDDVAGRQQKIDELEAQFSSVTDSADEQRREIQSRLESELALAHEQQASLERQIDELKNLHEHDSQQLAGDAEERERSATALQDEARALEVSLNKQAEEINSLLADKQAAAEALDRQTNEWDGERALIMSGNEEIQQRVKELEEQLANVTGSADEQTQALGSQLETMRQQLEEANLQAADRLAQLNGMQDEMAGIQQEAVEFGQQKEELQQSLGQRDEQESARQLDYEQSLQKARDDLSRKNETERELQGQLDRLRKKLDQTSAEFKNERDAARVDIDSVREELHTERSARSAERAEMASRQRELKEQLVAVASEHEENILNRSGAIEQAKHEGSEKEQLRVQQMREIQLETEDQLDKLQQELTQAHEEISALVQSEKSRSHEEHDLAEERKQQYESSLEKLQTQSGQLVQERDDALKEQQTLREEMESLRDDALKEQQTLREEMNSLRAEVEVTRGLMGNGQGQPEDPAKLRRELNEARANLLIAVRLRAEAETAGASLRDEREALQKQVGNNISLGKSLNMPSPDEEQGSSDRAVYAAQPEKKTRAGYAAIKKALAAVAAKRSRKSVGAATPTWHRVARILVLGVIVIAGFKYGVNAIADFHAAVLTQVQDNGAPPGLVRPVAQEAMPVVKPAPPVTRQQDLVAQGSFRDNLRDNGLAPLMVKLPAARYVMGSQGQSLNFDEGPQHEVSLSRFSISKYEVTFADYDRFARATGARLPHDETWGRGNRPVINVSWNDAQAYVQWLSVQTGHTYRLPTESQWEFAARAGELTPYPWDVDVDKVHANCFDCGSEWDQGSTAPVGNFPANHFGLHDRGGNVQEWTEDCYHAGYSGAPGDGSALLTPGCTQHTVRGGAYTSPLSSLRGTSRGKYDQDIRLDNLGFRITRMY